jgi:hypothetical protein
MTKRKDDGHLHPVVGTDRVDVLSARDGLATRRDVSKGEEGRKERNDVRRSCPPPARSSSVSSTPVRTTGPKLYSCNLHQRREKQDKIERKRTVHSFPAIEVELADVDDADLTVSAFCKDGLSAEGEEETGAGGKRHGGREGKSGGRKSFNVPRSPLQSPVTQLPVPSSSNVQLRLGPVPTRQCFLAREQKGEEDDAQILPFHGLGTVTVVVFPLTCSNPREPV